MPEHIRQEPKVLVSTENLTEQEWLAYRRQGIGGSDVAAILGISPFRTARDLYDDKLNIASAVDDADQWQYRCSPCSRREARPRLSARPF